MADGQSGPGGKVALQGNRAGCLAAPTPRLRVSGGIAPCPGLTLECLGPAGLHGGSPRTLSCGAVFAHRGLKPYRLP